MDLDKCLQLVTLLGAFAALWLRMEHRLTRVEDKVHERYRDKKAVESRLTTVEKWLPKPPAES
jgi:hypothetical protein